MVKKSVFISICLLIIAGIGQANPIWIYQTPGDAPMAIASIQDLDGDKLPEVVAGYETGKIICVSSMKKEKPEILWEGKADGTVLVIKEISDVNNDKKPEIAVSTDRGNISCISGGGETAGKTIWSYDAVFNISSLVVMEDSTNDAINEVAFGGADHKITLLNGKDGKILWSRFLDISPDFGPMVDCIDNAGDLNGDKISDIFARTWGANTCCISGKDGSDIWAPRPGSPFLSNVLTGKDINADGACELLESGNDGILYMHNGKSGETMWRCRLGRPVRSLAVSDDPTSKGAVYCFAGNAEGKISCINCSGSGDIKPLWTADIGDVCRSIIIIGDINNDGKPDIAAGAENGVVAAYSGADGKELRNVKGGDTVKTMKLISGDITAKDRCVAAAFIDGTVALLPVFSKTRIKEIASAIKNKPAKTERKRPAPSTEEIKQVPMLLYHDVPPRELKERDTSPLQLFKEQMEYMQKEGYNAVTLDELADWIEGKKNLPSKPVCITFDGQYASHYTHLAKILKDTGMFGVSYITTDWIGSANHLEWNQLRALENSGEMYIENHTFNHANLTSSNRDENIRQLTICNKAIENHLDGKISRHHAYPNGVYNRIAMDIVKELGFRTATTTVDEVAKKTDDLAAIPRWTIADTMPLASFITMLDPDKSPYPRLPYKYEGNVGENLRRPSYGDIDNEGKLWVCDYSLNQIRVFMPDGKEASFSPITQGMKQNGEIFPIVAPSGITYSSKGEILISISNRIGNNRHTGIFRYNSKDGTSLPGFDFTFAPGDIDVSSAGLIYVVDKMTDQWHILTPDGKKVNGSPFAQNSGLSIQRGISVTPDGSKVYIINESKGNVRVWEGKADTGSAEYKQLDNLVDNLSYGSGGVDVMDDGTVLVGYMTEGMIMGFDKQNKMIGQISASSPRLYSPRGTAFTPDGKILYVICINGQIQKWVKK